MNVKKLTLVGLVCLTSIAVSLGLQQVNVKKINTAVSLKSGLGTCFERVSQSFTALMTKNIQSSYLSQTFLTTTSDCISDANTVFESLSEDLTQRSAQLLNQFGSDYYWLSQKSLKLKALISASDINLESSNIVQKYSTLNDLKVEFSKELASSMDNLKTSNTSLLLVSGSALIIFTLSFFAFSFSQMRKFSFISKLDMKAKDLNLKNMEREKADRLMKDLFNKLKIKNMETLYSHMTVNSESVDDIPSIVPIPAVESTNLSDSISKHLELLSSKISSFAVKVDMKRVKGFNVKGSQELIDQIVFHTLNYACDFSKGELISLDTSILGGTGILKIKLNKHCFNSDELEFLNNLNTVSSVINLDLKLLKELTSELEGSFAVKNKIDTARNITQSEVEFIFSIPSVRRATTKKVMKGSKKDILKQMQSEA